MAAMVVGLHTRFLSDVGDFANYITVNGIFRIAVPTFLIISGFYFYPVMIKNNQSAWFKRVLILYFVWMFFYSYFWLSMPEFSLARLLFEFVVGYYHLWYIAGMIGAALILVVARKANEKFLILMVIMTFSIGVTIQYTGNYHVFSGTILDQVFNQDWSHRNAALFSFPFFCLGFLINKHSLHRNFSITVAALLTIAGMTLLVGESYLNFTQPGRGGEFDNYASLILACPALFILVANLNVSGSSKNLALYSTAIYLIHVLIIKSIGKVTHLDGSLLTLSVLAASVIASYFLVEANRKLKVIL